MPDEVVDLKYSGNGRFLWIKTAMEIHNDIKQAKEMENMRREADINN